ncbi:MAG: PH domain-containing protein [Microthrixaceae bacterium]|nr:PH domain-containing protein [Microthrixaceae bacterium]
MLLLSGPDSRVERALGDGETLYVNIPPDMRGWLIDQWLHIVAIAACVGVVAAADSGAVRLLGLVAVAGLTLTLVVEATKVSCTRYVITSHRAMRFSGVLRTDQEYLTWSKVTDVSVERSLADRLTGTATIRIHTASEKSSFKAMRDVGDPLAFAQWITRMVTSRQRRSG